MGILARLVDVEGMVRVLEGRNPQTTSNQSGDDFDQERGLARPAPTGETDDAHGTS
jgi:hypothetical protein